jgi:lipopolysaccharide transport system permease protein
MNDLTPQTTTESEVVVIKPVKGLVGLNLKEVWRYRELIYFFTWRDIKVRYKQSVLGILWAILQPFLSMVVFTIFFGNLAKVPSDGIPYPIFSYAALVPWTFFASALNVSARSMLTSGNMISKIYFPRIIVPLASIMANLVDFLIAFVILIGMMFYYHIFPTWNLLWLPVFLLLAIITALGVGLWLSALVVMYRDFGYIVGYLATFWQYISPVIYSATLVPQKYRLIFSLNPMTGVIEGFRWALLGTNISTTTLMFVISASISILICVSGLFYFRRMERIFADMI